MSNRKNEQIYLMGYMCYVISNSFVYNVSPLLSRCIKVGGVLLIALAYLGERIPVKRLFARCLVLTIIAVCLLNTESYSVAIFFLFVMASKEVRTSKLVRADFITRASGVIMTTIMYILDFASDNTLIRYSETGTIVRHSMGYVHPNTAFMMLFVVLLDYLVISFQNKTLNYKKEIVIILIAYIYQKQTGSRSGFVILLLACSMFCLEKRYHIVSRNSTVRFIITYASLFSLTVSYVLTKAYDKGGSIAIFLNKLLTGRLRSMSYFLNTYGISVFGKQTVRVGMMEAMSTGNRAYILDNFYMNLLVSYGVLFAFVFLILVCTTTRRLFLNDLPEFAIVWFMFCILGITEGAIINIDFNFYGVTLIYALYPRMDGLRKNSDPDKFK